MGVRNVHVNDFTLKTDVALHYRVHYFNWFKQFHYMAMVDAVSAESVSLYVTETKCHV